MSFSELKKYVLGDIIDIKHGFAFKGEFFSKTETEDVLLSPGNFKIGGGFKDDKFKYYNGNYPKEYILKENDIIVTMTDLSKEGDTLGYSAKIPFSGNKKYLHNQRLGLVQFKNEEFDKNFIYWLLRTKEYQSFIVNSATGTTVKHTAPSRIKEYEFLAPNKITQTKIANILSSLDDKIEINSQTNQTLETLAQTLFKEMCVPKSDQLPEGWRVGKLGDFYKTTSGGTPSRAKMEFYENGIINWVKSKELGDFFVLETEEKITEEALKKSSAKLLPINSILLAMYGATVGEISILGKEASCNQAICAILPNDKFPYSFVYEFLKNQKETLKNMAVGGAQQNISQQVILGIDVIIPSENILNEFHQKAEVIYSLVRTNIEEAITLKDLRDNLLPKLMKGEIEINNL